ncbi:hypothetical protein SNOG_05819 [Parastagonospora nodorum SN15]|uniref:Uncharacterized protein n=1 Tax=Phaeosphaeria nodorum (strain SN15 / ATCC MYA-4574 / FGSC 10173) TaxID=321614 RepID=Q0UQZ5_PHANO|nr:hypothetical protein SNOG_05819 [Parastagonospora nodorum SN15]EAT86883.1 hypothetical protein SNOG_05819 [Parastagonospora nodorum SN15]
MPLIFQLTLWTDQWKLPHERPCRRSSVRSRCAWRPWGCQVAAFEEASEATEVKVTKRAKTGANAH